MDNVISVLKQGLPNIGSAAAGAGNLDFLRNSQQVIYFYFPRPSHISTG